MLSSLWGRIVGGDKRKQFPEQKGAVLGRVGDFTVVYPYGLYADAPDDQLFRQIAPGVLMPVTVDRPADAERGEPCFFHPATGTRIIARNDKTLDIYSEVAVNVHAPQTNLGDGGPPIARVGDTVAITLNDPGEAWDGAPGEGTITSGGSNTSI